FKSKMEESAYRLSPFFAIIQGPMVDVHADEFVGEILTHIAGVLECVFHRRGAVVETVLNAGRKNFRNGAASIRRKSLMNHVSAQRQWQTVVLTGPPNAQIFADLQSFILVG